MNEKDFDIKKIFDIRDQFACAALSALIDKKEFETRNYAREDHQKENEQMLRVRMRDVSLMAYKLADEMRKARLAVFD